MIDTVESTVMTVKAIAASREIRHEEEATFVSFFLVCVGGSYSRVLLIESALFDNNVRSNRSGDADEQE